MYVNKFGNKLLREWFVSVGRGLIIGGIVLLLSGAGNFDQGVIFGLIFAGFISISISAYMDYIDNKNGKK